MLHIIKSSILIIMTFLSINISYSRDVYKLRDGWSFGDNINNKEYFSNITVPHSWAGANTPVIGHYTRDVMIDAKWTDKQIFLKFNGVSSIASLFVNNRFVGEHRGSHTAFTFDITPFIRVGQSNTITLNVNNSPQNYVIPFENEYYNFGGVFRDVELIVAPRTHISLMHFGSNGVTVRQNSITDNLAQFDVAVQLQGLSGDVVKANVTIFESNKVVATKSKQADIGVDGFAETIIDFEIDNPRLWSGKKDPFLYTAEVSLYDLDGKIVDNVVVDFGLRYFGIDSKKQFLLNGKPYPLYGVTITQDRFGVGSAYSEHDTKEDISDIIELGATAVRTTIGPLNQYFYDLCDREGIVVWCDFPFVSDFEYFGRGFINSYMFMSNAQEQLSEMLYQYNNHPSIAMYGIFNKISSKGDNPLFFIDRLNSIVHEISPDRFTTGTSIEDGRINFITDIIGWGVYFGWRENQTSDIKLWVNGFNENWKDINPSVAEYGAESFVNHHYSPKAKYDKNSALFPEESQKQFHITYSSAISSSDNLWGYFVSSMYDYRSSFYDINKEPIYRGFGLISYDRANKKDIFYLYKALWNKDDKFTYITAKRSTQVIFETRTIEVFSNCDKVELMVNGVSLGAQKPLFGVAKWQDVPINNNENSIMAIGDLEYRDNVDIKRIKTL